MKMRTINYLQKTSLLMALFSMGVFISCGPEDPPKPPSTEPIASFQFEVDSENFLRVTFSNFSQNATSYSWDFGDNSGTSTEESPVYTYEAAGDYTVTLTATGPGGENEQSQMLSITDPAVMMELLAGTTSKEWIMQREEIAIYLGPQAPYDASWWTFGGVTQLGSRPCILDDVYTFQADGVFLKNTNDTFFMDSEANGGWNDAQFGEGCVDDESSAGAFTASGNGADYSALANGGSYTYEYNTTERTITIIGEGAYMGLAKTITAGGDLGNSGTLPAQTVFSVHKLVDGPVADSLHLIVNGQWTYLFVSYDDPNNIPDIPALLPEANFTATPSTANPLTISFTNTSNEVATSFSWDFGDNSGTSTEENPTYTYAGDGSYMVTLTVEDGDGNMDMVTKSVVIGGGPETAAPTPTQDAGSVISIYSDAYTAATTVNLNPNWEQATAFAEVSVADGDNVVMLSNFNFQGIDFTTGSGGTPQDVSGMTMVHVDIYIPAGSDETIEFFLINTSPVPTAETSKELSLTAGQWNSFDIPLTDFSNEVPLDGIDQMKFDVGPSLFYYDNIYFY